MALHPLLQLRHWAVRGALQGSHSLERDFAISSNSSDNQ
jgi:hypothetical protein